MSPNGQIYVLHVPVNEGIDSHAGSCSIYLFQSYPGEGCARELMLNPYKQHDWLKKKNQVSRFTDHPRSLLVAGSKIIY